MWQYALVLAALVGVNSVQGQGVTEGPVLGPWWNSAVYYRILVDSFKDTDGDGLGDFKGNILNKGI